jgi:hypothetical protein
VIIIHGVSGSYAESYAFENGIKFVTAETNTDYDYHVNEDGTATITNYNGKNKTAYVPYQIDGYTVTEIGDFAFSTLDIEKIYFSSAVSRISSLAFIDADNLVSIHVSQENTHYTSIDGVLFDKDETTLVAYPASKAGMSYTVPNTVTRIGDFAFYYAVSLVDITLPDNLVRIGDSAFEGCFALAGITIPVGVIFIGEFAFYGCTVLVFYCLPDSYAEFYATVNNITVISVTLTPNVAWLKRYILKWHGVPRPYYADIDNDGNVDLADVICLKRQYANWTSYA